MNCPLVCPIRSAYLGSTRVSGTGSGGRWSQGRPSPRQQSGERETKSQRERETESQRDGERHRDRKIEKEIKTDRETE